MWKQFEWRWTAGINTILSKCAVLVYLTPVYNGDKQTSSQFTWFRSKCTKFVEIPHTHKVVLWFLSDILIDWWCSRDRAIRNGSGNLHGIESQRARMRIWSSICDKSSITACDDIGASSKRTERQKKRKINKSKLVKLTHVQRPCPNISPAFTFSFIKFLTTVPDHGENKRSTFARTFTIFFFRCCLRFEWERRGRRKKGHKSRGIIRLFGACQSHMALWPTDGDAATAPLLRCWRRLIFVLIIFFFRNAKSPPNDMWNRSPAIVSERYDCARVYTNGLHRLHSLYVLFCCVCVSFYAHSAPSMPPASR